MENKIEKIKSFRVFVLDKVKGLSVEQLNKIPQGYHNNIIWNIGHMISAQQTMCYVRAGLPVIMEQPYFSSYLSGTKPEAVAGEKEIAMIKELFITSIDQLQADYNKKLFDNYSPSVAIAKVYGFEVNDIDDALEYLLYHEGYHGGCIASLSHYF